MSLSDLLYLPYVFKARFNNINLLFCLCSYAQDEIVASEYFKNGEFEKALSSYKRLFKDKPYNTNYLLKIVNQIAT